MRPSAASALFAIAVVAVVPRAARADDPDQAETPHVEKAADGKPRDVPDLELVLWPQARGLGGVEQGEPWAIELGDDTRIDLTGLWWANADDTQPGQVVLDSEARGWTAGAQLTRDLGFAHLTLHGSAGQVDNELGRGRYAEAGVSLRKTFRLSRTMTGWISLGIGHRAWSKHSNLNEPDVTEVMLSIGTTW